MPTALRVIGLLLALVLPLACTGETVAPPPLPDPSALYWDLRLNHRAVTLSMTAPYDTLKVMATPRNVHQEPLMGLPAPTWVSRDPEHVYVTSEGVLVAVAPMAPGTQVRVVATLAAGNLKYADSLLVRVVADTAPPVLTTFSIQPVPPDSAKIAAIRDGQDPIIQRPLPLVVTDAIGAPMTDVVMSFRSSNRKIANVDELTGIVNGIVPGKVSLSGEATAFGVRKADTLQYQVGFPIVGRFVADARTDGLPGSRLRERQLKLGVGAAVMWQTLAADTTRDLDVTFTDPTHVAGFVSSPVYPYAAGAGGPAVSCVIFEATDCTDGGSFVLRRSFNSFYGDIRTSIGVRTFPVAGVYDFHSTRHGFDGRIIVVEESEE